jgi:hypothetical protein
MSFAPTISPIPLYAGLQTPNSVGPNYFPAISAIRKFAQGAGSALLVFNGADSIASGASAAEAGSQSVLDLTSLDALLQTLMTGGFNGPLQLGAAALLFLAAGRCVARFLGLTVAATAVVLYLQGVTFEDASLFTQNFMARLTAAAAAFQTADVG